jgi:hypothetical protein
VADLTGEPITGLSANAFTVIEDGVKRGMLKAEALRTDERTTQRQTQAETSQICHGSGPAYAANMGTTVSDGST